MAENWLELAPSPTPLPDDQTWHVFVSYRSSSRPWVLALYDILAGLGYKVFLDQYVLTAAAPLAISLGEGLDASQSGILVWSGRYEDSEWCKQEGARFEGLQNAGTGFLYVVAVTDGSKPAGLWATRPWVDFSRQPEGPAGTGLLQMLYGLRGEPLPPAAVKLAARVDEQMADGLLEIRTCRDIGDADGLVALAATDTMAWTSSPMLVCGAAEGLIAMERIPEALDVLHRAEETFPKAVRPKQLRGLALARSGDTIGAQRTLGKLYASGEIGPETLGILARTWMDRYNLTGDRTFLLKSRDLYRQCFEAFPTDFYTGINAAAKSLLLGEKETAAQIAARVQGVVGDSPVPGDYWKTANAAEVQLLQAAFDKAASLYHAAVVAAPLETGSHRSTLKQAKLLLAALEATDSQRDAIIGVFPPNAN